MATKLDKALKRELDIKSGADGNSMDGQPYSDW